MPASYPALSKASTVPATTTVILNSFAGLSSNVVPGISGAGEGGEGGGDETGHVPLPGIDGPLPWQAAQFVHSGLEASAGLSHVPTGQHARHALPPAPEPEPGQAAKSLKSTSWHAVDTVACWALLQATQEAGASPDWMTPPTAW